MSGALPPVHTRLVRSTQDVRTARAELRGDVAVVMTMGALHDGHLMLIHRAREIADHVILTDFVNPLQFGPEEDFENYPRDLDADLSAVDGLVDLVFAPEVHEMYPVMPPAVTVSSGRLGTVLEGAIRPGHYDGVLTVVTKLLHLTAPTVAVFGQKDAQQLAIIRNLVAELDLDVRIDAVPIAREETGLARSSRNAYLTDTQRRDALLLSRTIESVESQGGSAGGILKALALARTDPPVGMRWNYASAVDPRTFEPIDGRWRGETLVVLAAEFGTTRLLDATVVDVTRS